jgi:hypothetical protein
MKIAMIGSRGLGSSYGGIERVLTDLCPRLADLGHDVDVYSRKDVEFNDRPGVRAMGAPSFGGKYFETLSRSAASLISAMGRYDITISTPWVLAFYSGQPLVRTKVRGHRPWSRP